MAELAREAIGVQDASNLSGVAHGFARAMSRLRALLEAEGWPGQENYHHHPIAVLWVDKLQSLTGVNFERAWRWALDNGGR